MSGTAPTDQAAQNTPSVDAGQSRVAAKRPLTPAAERALAEAAARRAARASGETGPTPEIAGRGGLDPTRYGDWEINGLISDF